MEYKYRIADQMLAKKLKDLNKVHFTSCLVTVLSCISVVYERRKVKVIKLK